MNKIEHEPDNGSQQWVVYWVKGKTKSFRAAFSTEDGARQWIERYGDRDVETRNQR